MEATGARKGGYTVWRCQCKCGGEICLDTRALQRGTVRDCGCASRVRPGQRDITGVRFGKLVAVRPAAEQLPGRSIWHCQCDCGGTVDAPLGQLTSGYRKSCGCLSHPPQKDYVGVQFGRLTVLGYAGKTAGQHMWRCQCDCGKTVNVRQTNLQSGKTGSCGCRRRETIRENQRLFDGTSVTVLERQQTHPLASNTSGCTGVYWNCRAQRWNAQITFQKKTYFLGSFRDKQDAILARKDGEQMHADALARYYQENGGDLDAQAVLDCAAEMGF